MKLANVQDMLIGKLVAHWEKTFGSEMECWKDWTDVADGKADLPGCRPRNLAVQTVNGSVSSTDRKYPLIKRVLPGLRLYPLSAATHPLFFLLLYPRVLSEVRLIPPTSPGVDYHLIFLLHRAQRPKPSQNQERSRTQFCTLNSLHCRLLRRLRKDRDQRAVILLATPA